MADTLITILGVQVLVCAPDGAPLKSEQDALDLIGEAMQQGAELVVVPVERFTEDFFELRTRLAGAMLQKFVTYRRQLVVLGDISEYVEQSKSFRDFVYEANRGKDVWFLASRQELDERLKRLQEDNTQ